MQHWLHNKGLFPLVGVSCPIPFDGVDDCLINREDFDPDYSTDDVIGVIIES